MADITATALGNIAADTGVYKASEVDTIVTGVKEALEAKLVSAMHYKGHKDTFASLPTTGNEVGDVWDVGAADGSGDNYAWNGTSWDKLANTFQLPDYLANAALEAKYLQIANTDAKVAELGFIKADALTGYALETTVDSKIATALADYTKTEDLGALATKDEVAESDLAAALKAIIDAKAVASDVATEFAKYTKTEDLGALALKDEVAESDLASALATKINGKADQSAVDTEFAKYTKTADLDTYIAGLGFIKENALDDLEGDVSAIETKLAAAAAVSMPTRATVTLYQLYDAVSSIKGALA